MLNIFNDLRVFFEDNYEEIHVRAYAHTQHISPPTASKLLEKYAGEGLLTRTTDKRHHLYAANRDSNLFIGLSMLYWEQRLKDVTEHLEEVLIAPIIILFGSLSKAEVTPQSDIDIAVIGKTNKKPDFTPFEKKLGRTLDVKIFASIEQIPENLRKNILEGHYLAGRW